MARVYSSIPKFKRVEATLRETGNSCQEAVKEIDVELGRRGVMPAETALLNSIRERCLALNLQWRDVLGDLWDGVDRLNK